jgi:hypothetical protein
MSAGSAMDLHRSLGVPPPIHYERSQRMFEDKKKIRNVVSIAESVSTESNPTENEFRRLEVPSNPPVEVVLHDVMVVLPDGKMAPHVHVQGIISNTLMVVSPVTHGANTLMAVLPSQPVTQGINTLMAVSPSQPAAIMAPKTIAPEKPPSVPKPMVIRPPVPDRIVVIPPTLNKNVPSMARNFMADDD